MAFKITNPMTGMVNKPQTSSVAPANMSRIGEDTTSMLDKKAVKPVAPAPITQKRSEPTFQVSDTWLAKVKQDNPELFNGRPTIDVTDVGTSGVTVPKVAGANEFLPTPTPAGGEVGGELPEMSQRDMAMQAMMDVFAEQQGFDPTVIKEQEGVYTLREQAELAQQDYEQATIDQRRTIQEMRQNPEGRTLGQLDADIKNYKYESDQNLADKAMEAYYKGGSYERALSIANDAITAQTDRFTNQMNFFKNMYTMLGDDLTDSEKMQFQSQLSMQEYGFKSLQDSKQEAMRVAGVNGAPSDVLSSIKNASSPSEVWQAAGSYGIDPATALAKDKFYFEKELALKELALKEAIRAGQISAETATKLENKAKADAKFAKIEDEIQKVLSNELGFNVATGKVKGPIASALLDWTGSGGFFPNKLAVEDLSNSMDFISSNLTTQALADAKAQGITFGALSEKEMEVIGGSADILSAAWDKDSSSFRGEPENIATALEELRGVFSEKRAVNELGQAKVNETKTVWGQM